MLGRLIATSALALGLAAGAASAQGLTVGAIVELSGAGASAGTNYRDGIIMAFDEINAAGGILGRQVSVDQYDSQTDPQVSRALVQKAVDAGAFALMGTVYSSSTVVNMLVAQQNGIPQFTGSEAPSITAMGNPYIFRTAFGAQKGVPKIAGYIKDGLGARKVAVAWVNNEFGKGGYTSFMNEAAKLGFDVVADVPSEPGQADFAADVLRIAGSGAEAVFVYLHEEESARLLREAQKQGLDIPLTGETTLVGHKVLELAGAAAEGAMGHVGLSPEAPVPAVAEMVGKFKARFNYTPDHNAIKGYLGAWTIKYVTELVGAPDSGAIAEKMHGLCLDAATYPGVLLDVCWDDTGEISRQSFLVKVENGTQTIADTLPAN